MLVEEKAEQLISKFIEPTKDWDVTYGWNENRPSAIKCALIAAKEILMVDHDYFGMDGNSEYWDAVIEELKKLQ